MSLERTPVASAAIAGLLALGLPVAAGAQQAIEGGDSLRGAVELDAGSMHDPEVYTVRLHNEDPIFFDVDIPEGQRVHVGFLIDPAGAPEEANVISDLLDTQGNISSYVELDAVNDDTSQGLRTGYLRSEIMDPANRSWGRDTVLRVRGTGSDYPVQMSVSLIPDPVDGGGLAEVDRPPLRYAEDLRPVGETEPVVAAPGASLSSAGDVGEGTTVQTADPGSTRYFRVPVGWLQALDASVRITTPGDGVLSWKMFNSAHEPMTLVGDWEFSADRTDPATFGQRAPLHHKNAAAKNKTRNTGFLGDHVFLAVTNTSSGEVGYVLSLTRRGEAVEPGPVFDAQAAAEQARSVEAVDYRQNRAPGYEQGWWANPLWWAVGAILVAVIVSSGVIIRRS
ncbi:hypothetical protein [Corynebacterium guangdongense]|uniref:DUF916 domain-containing protein n=1 Tax=Corynebacterium guangdongense TaxID=1783348 RepID=A0ABU2A091_9CORY|nr:hypothetical protein [Corynebacterium guangdongense]MDR7330602.1 hypothetical protein [Corynebacterium guangdongense]WJZ16619.1 hypothetical protein CGUA_00035 [Corynebacterium guangdongense]